MLRSIIAVVVGILVAVVAVFSVEMAGHSLFPTPDLGAADCSNPETYRDRQAAVACTAATPLYAKIAVVVGWFLGALAGGAAALAIGRKWAPLAWVVAATILLLSVSNFVMFPHPVWMMAGSVLACALGGSAAVSLMRAGWRGPA